MGWKKKVALPVGYARVMADLPQSDGTVAYEILNFSVDERGLLESRFRAMPLHPKEWGLKRLIDGEPPPEYPIDLGKVIALAFFDFGMSGSPEIIFVTTSGIRRFTPWKRSTESQAIESILFYDFDNGQQQAIPAERREFPVQIEHVGRSVYFSFCDGSRPWVWDGAKLRQFGYTNKPPPPVVMGPSTTGTNSPSADVSAMLVGANAGGVAFPGRIGSLENDWTDSSGNVKGGIDEGLWNYYVVWENETGAYSAMSPISSPVKIHREMAQFATTNLYRLTRSFWVGNIGTGPEGTVARIILRTPNLMRLGAGDNGSPRFLKRIPNNVSTEFIDDKPDGELGSVWEDRETLPSTFYFMKHFSGSMFIMRTDEHVSRIWWSEQTNIFGATPESFMKAHWMDVFPETGAITGSASVRLGSGDNASALLIFKENAVHAIGGQYPAFQASTIRNGPGLAGPGLVQTVPDGSVIFYGANTFWRIDPTTGQVDDIGSPIRKRLNQINPLYARFGISWIEKKTAEVFFALPMEDSEENNFQFVFDYRYKGWRLRKDFKIKDAISIPRYDVTLIAGTYDDLDTVWVKNRGYQNFSVTHPKAKYSSGWFSLGEGPVGFASTYHLTDLVVTGEERGNIKASAYVYKEWDLSSIPAADSLWASHPEEDDIPYYSVAKWNIEPWRSEKFFQQRIGLDAHITGVGRVEIQTSSSFCLYGIDVYGNVVATPSGRVPEGSSS